MRNFKAYSCRQIYNGGPITSLQPEILFSSLTCKDYATQQSAIKQQAAVAVEIQGLGDELQITFYLILLLL
jgi:hypothetical protein